MAISARVGSDSSVPQSEWATLMRSRGCWSCGYLPGTQKRTMVRGNPWPTGEPVVSLAHLTPVKALESEAACGSRAPNFIPLCGTHRDPGTCHDLFYRLLLAFVFVPDHGKWHRLTHPEYNELAGAVCSQDGVNPSKTLLHAHAETALARFEEQTKVARSIQNPDDRMDTMRSFPVGVEYPPMVDVPRVSAWLATVSLPKSDSVLRPKRRRRRGRRRGRGRRRKQFHASIGGSTMTSAEGRTPRGSDG